MNRQSHQPPKDLSERRDYFETVIRGPGPTSEDTAPFIDTTDHSVSPQERAMLATPIKLPSALQRFFREKWVEILIGAVLIPLLFAVGYQMYTLNREVGEIHTDFKNITDRQTRADSNVEKLEEKLSNRIVALEHRIDALFERRPLSHSSSK